MKSIKAIIIFSLILSIFAGASCKNKSNIEQTDIHTTFNNITETPKKTHPYSPTAKPTKTVTLPKTATPPPVSTPAHSNYDDYNDDPYTYDSRSAEEIKEQRINDPYLGYKNGKKVYELKLSNNSNSVLYPTYSYNEEVKTEESGEATEYYAFKMGFVDGNFKRVAEEKYENKISYTYDGNKAVAVNAGYVLLDMKGNILLDKSDYVFSDNYNGNIYIHDRFGENNYGIFNLNKGKIEVPCLYGIITFISGDRLLVSEMYNNYEYTHIINKNMDVLYDLQKNSQRCSSFIRNDTMNNCIPVEKGSKIGYINENGKLIIGYKYVNAQEFINGKAIVMGNNKYAQINKKGEILKTFTYDYVSAVVIDKKVFYEVVEGDSYGYDNDDKTGIMDENMNVIIPVEEQSITVADDDKNIVIHSKDGTIEIYNIENRKRVKLDLNVGESEHNSVNVNKYENFIKIEDYIYNINGTLLMKDIIDSRITYDGKYMWIADGLYKGYIDSEGKWMYKEKMFNIYD